MLDLDYKEDAAADVDMNVVMTGQGYLIEVQGTAEGAVFDRRPWMSCLIWLPAGIDRIIAAARSAWCGVGGSD